MNKVTDPTPAPPLEGRGAAAALPATGTPRGTPLPCRGGAGVGSDTLLICTKLFFIITKLLPFGRILAKASVRLGRAGVGFRCARCYHFSRFFTYARGSL